jgi:hypothetical protein
MLKTHTKFDAQRQCPAGRFDNATSFHSQVVWPEQRTQWATPDGVHSSWLQIDEDSTGNVLVTYRFKAKKKKGKKNQHV